MKKIRFGSIVAFLFAILIGALSLLSVQPSILIAATKVTLRSPGAQILAFRGWIAVFLFGSALFFLIMGYIRHRLIDRGRIAYMLAIILALSSLGHASIMTWRGLNAHSEMPEKTDNSITVLEYNSAGLEESVDIAQAIADNHADVALLPETSEAEGEKIRGELSRRGLSFHLFSNGRSPYDTMYSSTLILVSQSLGEYQAHPEFTSEKESIHALMISPTSGDNPGFIAVHPVSPSQAHLRAWRVDIYEAYALCAAYKNVVVGGDFNSTADHEAALHLGMPCRDAGAEADAGAVGTWPSNLPAFFSAPIDRVMTNSAYVGTQARVVTIGDSDHKGIVVRLEK